MRPEDEEKVREILTRLRDLRAEEDRLQLELFELCENSRLLEDANSYYSANQLDEMNGKK